MKILAAYGLPYILSVISLHLIIYIYIYFGKLRITLHKRYLLKFNYYVKNPRFNRPTWCMPAYFSASSNAISRQRRGLMHHSGVGRSVVKISATPIQRRGEHWNAACTAEAWVYAVSVLRPKSHACSGVVVEPALPRNGIATGRKLGRHTPSRPIKARIPYIIIKFK